MAYRFKFASHQYRIRVEGPIARVFRVAAQNSSESARMPPEPPSIGVGKPLRDDPKEGLVEVSATEYLLAIDRALRGREVAPFVPIITIVLGYLGIMLAVSLDLPGVVSVGIGVAAVAATAWCYMVARRFDAQAGQVMLVYDLDDEADESFTDLQRALRRLAGSSRVWHVPAEALRNRSQHPSGARLVLRKYRIRPSLAAPPKVVSNVRIPMVYSESKRLCFCPDRLLVFESNQVRGVDYSDVVVRIGRSTCIEDEDVPVDARIVGQTWLYLRPDGSPERGYGGNRRYPVAEYADITIAAPCGVNELFQCSDPMGADDLAVALRHLGVDAELDDVASEDRYERAPDGDRYSDSARSETGTADAESDPATLYEAALRLLVENRFTTTAALGEALGIDGARAEALVSELAFDGYIVWEEIPDRFRPTRAATRYIELLNRARSSDDPRDRRSRRTRQGGPRWHHRDGSRRHGTGRRATSSDRSPYDVLGVATGSSRDEISAAYHLLAQMYHPDKVANLGPEFQMLAEQRMKEINAAYRALTAGVKQ